MEEDRGGLEEEMAKNRARATAPGVLEGIKTVSEEQEEIPTPDQEGAAADGEESDWNSGPNYKETARRASDIRRYDDESQDGV